MLFRSGLLAEYADRRAGTLYLGDADRRLRRARLGGSEATPEPTLRDLTLLQHRVAVVWQAAQPERDLVGLGVGDGAVEPDAFRTDPSLEVRARQVEAIDAALQHQHADQGSPGDHESEWLYTDGAVWRRDQDSKS